MAGFDPTTGRLTRPFTKIAKNGQGDFQRALGSTKKRQSELFALDYNLWAKFKAFRNSAPYTRGVYYDSPNSARLAGLKAANYGLNIVSCGRVDFASKYTNLWTLNKPTIHNWPLRPEDFDGYQKNCWWQLGGGSNYIYTIFNGYLEIAGTLISDNDRIYFNMQCKENDDMDVYEGLLYPYDFQGCTKDFSAYYVGIAVLDHLGGVWIITGPRVSNFYSGTMLYTGITCAMSSSIPNGEVKIAPILTQNEATSWTNGYNGDIIILHGAYLTANKVAQTANLQTNVTFTRTSSSITLNFEIKNQTGNAITINDMWCYLLSDGAYMNEHDNGYPGPDYMGEGAAPYITRTWLGLNTRPDVYSHMWDGGSTNPDQLAARSYNAYADFYAANGNSNVLGNNTTRTWSKTFNYTGDDFGAYANGAWALLCMAPTGNVFVREYQYSI